MGKFKVSLFTTDRRGNTESLNVPKGASLSTLLKEVAEGEANGLTIDKEGFTKETLLRQAAEKLGLSVVNSRSGKSFVVIMGSYAEDDLEAFVAKR